MRTIACALVLAALLFAAGPADAAQLEAADSTSTNGEASGPYITTDPQTGDRILGVARPARKSQDSDCYGPVYVVPEIDVPAQQQPAKPVQIYRPGDKMQPGVYRPGS